MQLETGFQTRIVSFLCKAWLWRNSIFAWEKSARGQVGKCTGPTTILPHQKISIAKNGCIDTKKIPKCVRQAGLSNAPHPILVQGVVVEESVVLCVGKVYGAK